MKREILIIALTFFLISFISAVTINVNGACVNTIPGDDPLCDDAVTYLTIQGAVDAAANGDTINVAAGTYNERVDITKPLNFIGAGVGNSTIDATSFSVQGDVITITALTGNTKIEGFDIKTGDYSNGIVFSGGTDAAGTIEIKNNHIISTNSVLADDQFGIIAGYGNLRKLIISGNQISNTYSNSILVERQIGKTEVTNNTLEGAFPSIFFMTYNGDDVTTLQKVNNNTINMESADPTWYGSAITFNSARRNIPSESLGLGKYTNISIEGNVIGNLSITSLNNYKGIHLVNDDPAGTGGEITGAVISKNQISGSAGNNAVGIKLSGKITGTNIKNNVIKDLSIGLLGVSNNNDAGTQYPSTTTFSAKNNISGNTLGVNWPSLSPVLNATYNWWGSCDGPGPVGPGSGDSISTNVDFTPWTGICITNKIDVQCAEQSKNVMLSANVSSFSGTPALDNVWFSYTINSINYNKTGVNTFGDVYNITINSSQLVGGQSIVWNVYANDTDGFIFKDGTPTTFYVRNSTFLGIAPWPWDGRNASGSGYGWWVTGPTFSLTKDTNVSAGSGDSWYQWDSDNITKYTGYFGLEDIPNENSTTAGTLELNWWTEFSCGNETVQSQILKIDLINPVITDFQPTNGSIVFNNPRPIVIALLDEIYGSNSGINMSNVSMTLNGPLGNSSLIPGNLNVTNVTPLPTIKAFANFTPSVDLANGNYQVQVNATDNAGRFSSKTWNFEINQTAAPLITVNSPKNITYGTKKIPFNITLSSEAKKMEYINYNDRFPRWKILCRDCNQSGFDKQKNKTLLEGENVVGIRATDSLNQVNATNVSLFIDSKKPKIHKTEPGRNKVTNGSFLIKYTEDNVKEVLLSWNPTVNITSQCNEPGKNVVCNAQVDLTAFNGQEIEYQVNITDIANKTDSSRPTKVLVDTTEPVINFFNHSINGRSVEFIIHVTESNFDEINYLDSSEDNPREIGLCSSLKDGICKKKKTFSNGEHNLTINVLDDAGNIVQTSLNFIIV